MKMKLTNVLFLLYILNTNASNQCHQSPFSSSEGCGCATATDRSAGASRDLANDQQITQHDHEMIMKQLQDAVKTKLLNREAMEETPLVTIPGGEFTMGTNDPKIPYDGEGPARRVKVDSFFLQQYEVSNRQFAEFVLQTGYETEAEKFGWSFCFEGSLSPQVLSQTKNQVVDTPWWLPVTGASWFHPNGPDKTIFSEDLLDYPVSHISYNDAKKYCSWLGMRLPLEAEFERAARGGLEQNRYPWGNELLPNGEHKANLWQGDFPNENLASDGYASSCPVKAFGPQNAYGLYNIIGNVWEWVADAWSVQHRLSNPDGTVLENPLVEIQGRVDDPTVNRVKRGGSYMCHISYCYRYRVEARTFNSADSSAQNMGIRCAKDFPDDEEDDIAVEA